MTTTSLLHSILPVGFFTSSVLLSYFCLISTPEMSRVNILNLPEEMLRLIFGQFQERIETRHARSPRRPLRLPGDDSRPPANLETIQNLRLVCRHFNLVASYFLCTVLRIRLSEASLKNAVNLCRNASIADGIRGITILLGYRPSTFAHDGARFYEHWSLELGRIYHRCEEDIESLPPGLASEDPHDPATYIQGLTQYLQEYETVMVAWQTLMDSNPMNEKSHIAYQDALIRSHSMYREMHVEQLRMITDMSFARAIAGIIFRLGRPVSLTFVDHEDVFDGMTLQRPERVLKDPQVLSHAMVLPQSWPVIGKSLGPEEFVPGRIIVDLMISIYRTGATVQSLDIGSIPTWQDFSQMCGEALRGAKWLNFAKACQGLRVLRFGFHPVMPLPNYAPAVDKTYLNNSIGAMLASRDLEDIALDMSSYRAMGNIHYRLGAIVHVADWPRLRRLHIVSVGLDRRQLESFCGALGTRLETLILEDIVLFGGRWSAALDVLRRKVAPQCRAGRGRVRLTRLAGGEFGYGGPTMPGYLSIVELARRYIAGEGEDENPLSAVTA
ncbi:hypothetical protein ACRALDRAFT_2029461 [Sodiomyces alcalophilus JCM 7366]|uniref:uncharacterized protein n=1 Tax=Sodiomyces alcalophilus JCM 7366 TaxID=591952 RepID=UPI0039B3957B